MQTRGRRSKNLKILRTSYLVVVHSIDRSAGGRQRRGFNANPSESGKSVRGIFHPNGDFILSLFSPSNSKNRTTAFLPSIQSALQKLGQQSAIYPLNNWVLQPDHGNIFGTLSNVYPTISKMCQKVNPQGHNGSIFTRLRRGALYCSRKERFRTQLPSETAAKVLCCGFLIFVSHKLLSANFAASAKRQLYVSLIGLDTKLSNISL